MIGKNLPDLAVVSFDWSTIQARYTHCFQWYTLRKQHAVNIMIGDDEQLGRRTKAGVLIQEQARVDVPVWADDR